MRAAEDRRMLQLLLTRLERVSVDSYWAHRASGVRGSLLRALEAIEAGKSVSAEDLRAAIDRGFWILRRAAEERSQ